MVSDAYKITKKEISLGNIDDYIFWRRKSGAKVISWSRKNWAHLLYFAHRARRPDKDEPFEFLGVMNKLYKI